MPNKNISSSTLMPGSEKKFFLPYRASKKGTRVDNLDKKQFSFTLKNNIFLNLMFRLFYLILIMLYIMLYIYILGFRLYYYWQ